MTNEEKPTVLATSFDLEHNQHDRLFSIRERMLLLKLGFIELDVPFDAEVYQYYETKENPEDKV